MEKFEQVLKNLKIIVGRHNAKRSGTYQGDDPEGQMSNKEVVTRMKLINTTEGQMDDFNQQFNTLRAKVNSEIRNKMAEDEAESKMKAEATMRVKFKEKV